MVDNALKRCAICQHAPAVGIKSSRLAQAKAKYCAVCRTALRRRPRSNVTPEQAAQLRELVGQVSYPEIQRRLGLSKAAITRWCWDAGITHPFWNAYKPDVVAAVLVAYESAPRGTGKARVQEQFPDVCVRSIVERYKQYRPRQIRWTAAQLLEAARMAGLVSRAAQSRFFGRPYANDGSVKALWVKRFRCSPHDINGLAAHAVWPLCGAGTPAVLVKYQTHATQHAAPMARVLWVTLRTYLKPDVDPAVREAVEALADFQNWLHAGAHQEAIQTMIREREHDGEHTDAREYERAYDAHGHRAHAGSV